MSTLITLLIVGKINVYRNQPRNKKVINLMHKYFKLHFNFENTKKWLSTNKVGKMFLTSVTTSDLISEYVNIFYKWEKTRSWVCGHCGLSRSHITSPHRMPPYSVPCPTRSGVQCPSVPPPTAESLPYRSQPIKSGRGDCFFK